MSNYNVSDYNEFQRFLNKNERSAIDILLSSTPAAAMVDDDLKQVCILHILFQRIPRAMFLWKINF